MRVGLRRGVVTAAVVALAVGALAAPTPASADNLPTASVIVDAPQVAAIPGDTVQVRVFVSALTPGGPIPTGTVAVSDNSAVITGCAAVALDPNGYGFCNETFPEAATGSSAFTAVYTGDVNYAVSTASTPWTVPIFGNRQHFGVTNQADYWTVPSGLTSAYIVTSGSAGPSPAAGNGGTAAATIPLTPGATMQVNVGSAGWGGGSSSGAASGGASDIRVSPFSNDDRLLIGGGGGGPGHVFTGNGPGGSNFDVRGGDGGYPAGGAGAAAAIAGGTASGAGGGTQSSGGAAGTGSPPVAGAQGGSSVAGSAGGYGFGGAGFPNGFFPAGSGGGGYYGGGGGGQATASVGRGIIYDLSGAGGGGSSFGPAGATYYNGNNNDNGYVDIYFTGQTTTKTSISLDRADAPLNDPIVATATVTPSSGSNPFTAPDGTFAFTLDGATAIPDCAAVAMTASCTFSVSTPGPHSVTTTYSGDAANAPSTSTAASVIGTLAPTFTSDDATTFTVGAANLFSVTTSSAFPAPTVLSATNLPAGITATDNGDGTMTLAGASQVGAGGVYAVVITAKRTGPPNVPDAHQTLTLTLDEAPSISSADTWTIGTGRALGFSVTSNGYPKPATMSLSGTLPSGLSYQDNGDGTGSITGTVAFENPGTFPVTVTSSATTSGPPATQPLTITVVQTPEFLEGSTAQFYLPVTGETASLTLHTRFTPGHVPTFTDFNFGEDPTFSMADNGDGTMTLTGHLESVFDNICPRGVPHAGFVCDLLFDSSNSDGDNFIDVQVFALQAPSITSTSSTFIERQFGSVTLTTAGYPTPTTTLTGDLPTGLTAVDNGDGTITISGTPTESGTFPQTLTASSTYGSPAVSNFDLTVNPPPFTGPTNFAMTAAIAGGFEVDLAGDRPFPTTMSVTNTLPSGLHFTDNGDGSGTFSGTPEVGTQGHYSVTVTAHTATGTSTEAITIVVNSAAGAVSLYVDQTNGTRTDGCSAPDSEACQTIAQAITVAESLHNSQVTIHVAAGTYIETSNVLVPPDDTITVVGAGPDETFLQHHRLAVFQVKSTAGVTPGLFTVTDVTISDSGGLTISGALVTLTHDVIENNDTRSNAVIMSDTSTLTLSDDSFIGNLENSVDNLGGTLTMDGVTIDDTNNVTDFEGGDLGGPGTVSNVNLGAGAQLRTATATLTNVTIDSVFSFANAFYNTGVATLSHVTLTADGGGLVPAIFNEHGGALTLANSIIDDYATDCTGVTPIADGGYNVTASDDCGLGTTSVVDSGGSNLAPLAANGSTGPQTIAIDATSSAYHLVPAAVCATTDERGEPRPGSGNFCDAGAFELQDAAAPVISGIAPARGPVGGGTTVTITGHGFNRASTVLFGVVPAASFAIVDDTSITAVSPAGSVGVKRIQVTTAAGTTLVVPADRFTYAVSAPVVTSIAPASGTTAGGTLVTIVGSGFTGATKVLFGTVAGTTIIVASDTSLTVLSPAQAVSTRDVRVVTAGGTSMRVPADHFRYRLVTPSVSALSPKSGGTTGGTAVTITGSGFLGTTAVTFGGIAATSFTVNSDASITAVVPPHAKGIVSVQVTTPGGTSLHGAPTQFTYVLQPH